MAENKSKATAASVEAFIQAVDNEQKRKDAFEMLEIMKELSGEEPVLWGPSLIGFGNYHYQYASGRAGDFFIVGFSPRKTALAIYIMPGFERYADLMQKLGKYKTGKSCLYVKKLTDVDMEVLKTLISESIAYMLKKYPRSK